VGQVAARFGVTVRTLHHYDEIGLVTPSRRSRAGYRLYTDADLARLQQVVVYRRLGFPLEEIAALLDEESSDVVTHLRRQRAAVQDRLTELTDLVGALDRALDRALEAQMTGGSLTPDEQRELFGEHFDDHQQEAEQRWGDTDAWAESQRRTARYGKREWQEVKDEEAAIVDAFAGAKRAGEPATGEAAMDVAERHRRHIDRRFYDLGHDMHRHLAELYVDDPRFTRRYEDVEPGLAEYVRAAIHANADRHGRP
jgi:DNA-binding transcriptional MerR regulator